MMIISVVVFMARRLLQRRRTVHPYPTNPTVTFPRTSEAGEWSARTDTTERPSAAPER